MSVSCKFCDEPAERVCSWVVGHVWHNWERVPALCNAPVCFRHMIEPDLPGEALCLMIDGRVYCADHWGFAEKLPRMVSEEEARWADEHPEEYNPPRRKRAAHAG